MLKKCISFEIIKYFIDYIFLRAAVYKEVELWHRQSNKLWGVIFWLEFTTGSEMLRIIFLLC